MDCALPVHVFFVYAACSLQIYGLSMTDILSKADRWAMQGA